MIMGVKVRLRPTEGQEQSLWQSAGTARFIYNWTLARQEENYANGGKFISNNDLRKEITQLKRNELSWLKEVSNNVAKQAVKDACDTYKKFFKGLCDKPKFKSRKKSKPSFYNDNEKLKVKESAVLIEKVGWVKVKKNAIPMSLKYSNPRVSFHGKYWFISVGIEKEQPKLELTGESIGIDVGIKDLAICSNGMKFKNINKTQSVKKLEKRLRRLQRRVSCKYLKNKNGGTFAKTCNIIKIEREIRLLHRRLANIRSNHNHQATNAIVKTKPSRVVMETLNIKGMMKNKHLSKAIMQQCLHEFKRQIKYKCAFSGIEFVEADRWYPSSKTCSGCGHIKAKLSLSERTYVCEECGSVIDRDLNASINLSRYESVV
ncbi:putative transposase [Peptoclostridium litorale DSM 5388]|uniref:Insertion sequence element IS609 n=1 Tax=Peptoclostridium litorale DSM 5388 TaxID=1121324 RepID=A0A069RI96_PEPLI|nr:RNA-guided endonuclease TnpB family protein [Peptoclostridium litorale]KDR96721.1 insertion sequence element IS609 [Peptoclostridium litorale DSM 5388]SIN67429.1 putative transposase [Peptoclostridium litorale DSM 5388]